MLPCAPTVKSFYENEDGLIDIELIFNENGTESDYFISGPPSMIKSFNRYLIANGIPVSQLRTDDWE